MDFNRQFAGEQAAAPGVEVEDWHFDILEVGTDASRKAIMRSYKSKIRGVHPDGRNSAPELLRWAQMLNDAKEALCDEDARERDRRRRVLQLNAAFSVSLSFLLPRVLLLTVGNTAYAMTVINIIIITYRVRAFLAALCVSTWL